MLQNKLAQESKEREVSQQLNEKLLREAGELRGVLTMYEELLDKLTDQNKKLKDWIKKKKKEERKLSK
jgi:hypothetical protein